MKRFVDKLNGKVFLLPKNLVVYFFFALVFKLVKMPVIKEKIVPEGFGAAPSNGRKDGRKWLKHNTI